MSYLRSLLAQIGARGVPEPVVRPADAIGAAPGSDTTEPQDPTPGAVGAPTTAAPPAPHTFPEPTDDAAAAPSTAHPRPTPPPATTPQPQPPTVAGDAVSTGETVAPAPASTDERPDRITRVERVREVHHDHHTHHDTVHEREVLGPRPPPTIERRTTVIAPRVVTPPERPAQPVGAATAPVARRPVDRATSQRADGAAEPVEPTVHVHIGRVVVRTPAAPTPPQPPRPTPAPAVDLDAYLTRRSGGQA